MIERRRNFNDAFAFGRIAESDVGRWLTLVMKWRHLPAYEVEIPSGKGPRFISSTGEELVAPDLLSMKRERKKILVKWHEVKHKNRFTWRYTAKPPCWQTGIDLRHYLDYIKVQEDSGVDVYVLFLHIRSDPSKSDLEHGSEPTCPTGLYGQSLTSLMTHEHHRDSYNNGRRDYPMVYWNVQDLERLATLEEVRTLPVSLWQGVTA